MESSLDSPESVQKLVDLQSMTATMKAEIDALQIAVTGARKPWFKDVSTIMAAMALLFSFGTTYVSYRHTEAQDVQSTRQELRGLLQRLTALPKENLEFIRRYKDDPGALNTAGSLITQETALLARQSAELTKRLPKGSVSATEYMTVAQAFQSSYNFDKALEFMNLGLQAARDFPDEIAALREMAALDFIKGAPDAGRQQYQEALKIFEKYKGYDPFTVNVTTIGTELAWAFSEGNSGARQFVGKHITNAESVVNNLPDSPGAQIWRSAVLQAKAQLQTAPPSSPLTPLAAPTAPLLLPQ